MHVRMTMVIVHSNKAAWRCYRGLENHVAFVSVLTEHCKLRNYVHIRKLTTTEVESHKHKMLWSYYNNDISNAIYHRKDVAVLGPYLNLASLKIGMKIAGSLNATLPYQYRNISADHHTLNHTEKLSKPVRQCWKCKRELKTINELKKYPQTDSVTEKHPADMFYCAYSTCGVLQPPFADNYFQQLGLAEDYDIDTQNLTRIYRQLQHRLHPDKATNLSQEEKNYAGAQSAEVNKAYDALLKPVPRALYLLQMNGLSLDETDLTIDPEFLMDIMDINEQIADTVDEPKLRMIFDENQAKIQTLIKIISKAFKDQNYAQAKVFIAEIKYLVNIEEKIKEKTYFY